MYQKIQAIKTLRERIQNAASQYNTTSLLFCKQTIEALEPFMNTNEEVTEAQIKWLTESNNSLQLRLNATEKQVQNLYDSNANLRDQLQEAATNLNTSQVALSKIQRITGDYYQTNEKTYDAGYSETYYESDEPPF